MRTFIGSATLAILLFSTVGSSAEPVRLASKVSGHIHPALCRAKDGTLVAIFSQENYKDLRLTRSTDGGKTWSEPVPCPPTEKLSIYPGSLTTLEDGRLVHFWNTWYGEGKEKSRFPQYAISNDAGKTWSEAKSLPRNPDAQSVLRHPLLELGAGRWLLPLMDKTIVYEPATGKTAPFADGKIHGLVPIVRTTKGTLVSGKGLRSTDDGKTWAEIKPFPKIGSDGWRHDLVALDNGWLLAGEVIGPGIGGTHWHFVLSRDDGQSWDFEHPHVFYKPGRPIGGRACPRTVQLDKDTIGTLFYDDDRAQTGGAGVFFLRTPLPDLGPVKK